MDNYGILQHMGFYPPTENQCVMMREDLKTQLSEYIYIAGQTSQYSTRQIQDHYQSRFLSRR